MMLFFARHALSCLTQVGHFGNDEETRRRLLRRCPTSTGIGAPLHRNTQSAYLGHVHVADTQWYLDSSPELMREAMQRLERRWEVRS
jgi:hypothetical protein